MQQTIHTMTISKLSITIFFFLTTIPVACSNNETDFRALVAVKNAIDTDPQGALNSWNETIHFCSWHGVSCSRRHQNRVVAIDLVSQGLIGTISPHLGNLSFLRSINLQNNSFTGQIPNEIGNLRRLEQVEFSNNSLSGQIPSSLSNCTNIYYLNLIDNDLTGIIPPELSSLMELEALGLSDNPLSGPIPPFIGNFTRLVRLSLSGMQGQIPESLVRLKSLRLLLLSGNLTGSVPPGLFNISTMYSFDLSLNRLEGTIPSDIGSTLPNLRRLSLWGNLFNGEIPASVSNITSLVSIRLQRNEFHGRVNIDFSRLTALNKISMAYNNLEGDFNFISSAINCTQLENFAISSNQLRGMLPHSIANLSSNLRSLAIDNNNLNGRIPSGIGHLLGLLAIDLSNNDLDGPIPSDIGKLNNLQSLGLTENKFTSEIPLSFGNLTSLVYLNLDRNNFSGNIPQSLSNFTNLLSLAMSFNSFSGSIPREIMTRGLNLVMLDLSHNSLTGSIPIEVGSLVNLGYLDLSYNRLSGHVPNSLSTCVTLEVIYLQCNSFSGEIPDGLRTMRGLQSIDLSVNNISGTIPTFLGDLDLLYLNLSFNRLEGGVPSQGVFLNGSALSLEGNEDLCGGIPSLNLTPCAPDYSNKRHFPVVFKVLIPVIGAGAIAFACYCIFICKKRKRKDSQNLMVAVEDEYVRISYADLLKSTSEFSESNLLGSGRFGFVYKGTLHNVPAGYVAVKVLNLNITGASKSFLSECKVLRNMRHRNLVKVVSVCSSTDFQGNDFKALVYEYMVNGDLDQWLHQKQVEDGRGALSLRQRLDIILDIASAVEYLHFGTGSTIVHGDLKPSNVLLDEKMTAHVGDFGLAKIISNTLYTKESSSIVIRGTIGYIPPEYGMGGNVSTHGDVYSYGILLLEMFTGKRPTNDVFKDSWSLPLFVRSGLSSEVMDILDPVIMQEFKKGMDVKLKKCVVSVLEVGLACSTELPGDRMDMTHVVNRLRGTLQMRVVA